MHRVHWEMISYLLSPFKVQVLALQGPLVNGVVHFMGDVSLLEVSADGGGRCSKGVNVWVMSVYRMYLLYSFMLQTILLHSLLNSTQMNHVCPTWLTPVRWPTNLLCHTQLTPAQCPSQLIPARSPIWLWWTRLDPSILVHSPAHQQSNRCMTPLPQPLIRKHGPVKSVWRLRRRWKWKTTWSAIETGRMF